MTFPFHRLRHVPTPLGNDSGGRSRKEYFDPLRHCPFVDAKAILKQFLNLEILRRFKRSMHNRKITNALQMKGSPLSILFPVQVPCALAIEYMQWLDFPCTAL